MFILPKKGERLITKAEFANRLGVHVTTIDRLHHRDPAFPLRVRLGGRIRYHLSEVEAYILQLEQV